MKSLALLSAIIAMLASNAAKADELCSKLKDFETAARAGDAAKPQWVDVYWAVNDDAVFSAACVHHRMPASGALCGWLIDNMSKEFAGLLPKRILECSRVGDNPFEARAFPARTIGFDTRRGGRFVVRTEGATESMKPRMRLAIFPDRRQADMAKLPAMTAYQDDAD